MKKRFNFRFHFVVFICVMCFLMLSIPKTGIANARWNGSVSFFTKTFPLSLVGSDIFRMGTPLPDSTTWWDNWWFRCGVLLLVSGMLGAALWSRFKSARKQSLLFEQQVQERTDELQKANFRLEEEIALRKRAETELASSAAAELRRSETRFQAMFDNAAMGIMLMGLDRYPIAVNDATLKMTGGYTREEMLSLQGESLVYPADREIGLQEYGELIAGTRDSFQVEKRYIRKDKAVFWVRLTLSAVRDEQGKALYLITMIEDIDDRKRIQLELQDSKSRFQAVFDNAATGILLMDLNRIPIAANDATLRIFGGYTRDELHCLAGDNPVFPPDLHVGQKEYRELLEGKRTSFQIERRYLRKDQSVFWVRLNVSAIRDSEGNFLHLVAMIEDIDERKRFQIELEESESRFRGLFDHAELGIVLTTVQSAINVEDDDNFYSLIHQQRCNPALQRIFGYNEQELLEMDLTMLVHPEDRGQDKALAKDLYSGKRDDYRIEKRYVRKDGSVFLGRLSYTMVRDITGAPRMAIGIIEDIDEERRAQEDLRQSEARFRAMFDNTSIGIALMSLEKHAIQVNQAAQRIVGYSQEELREINVTNLALEEYRELDRESFASLVEGKIDQYEVEKRYRRKNGQIFWGRVNYSSVRGPGMKPQYLIGLIEDIDDQKRSMEKLAEQEAEYRRMLEQRVLERTHELSETNERLQKEILQRQRAEEALAAKAADEAVIAERTRLARELHDAVTQTLFSASLIAEVLPELWNVDETAAKNSTEELRQLTRGALAEMRTLLLELRPSVLTQTRFEDLLRQLCEALIGRARLPIQMNITGMRPLPPDVQIALYRIAQESLNNIVKYARPKQVWVDLQMGEGGVLMTVRDDGIGFDPTQLKPSSLGLRIMRERAENIGAELTITSQPGRGTEVAVVWQIENP
jgi:PAS domain S-box-containing protein